MFRQTIFWLHLICGVTAGLIVLMMSVTGVVLTYERQLTEWATRPETSHGTQPMAIDALLATVRQARPDFSPLSITIRNDANAPVELGGGRAGTLLVDRQTGAVLVPAGERLQRFFAAVEGWHRWFNATGERRATARAITGASNLAFLFLVVSGLYLWLPRTLNWFALKTRLWFNPLAKGGKARDFNWHHVFGIWSAVPLAVVVATAVVFSYPWANDLVYRSVGEDPPVRGVPPRPGAATGTPSSASAVSTRLSYTELFERAAANGEWRTLVLSLPTDPTTSLVRFSVDRGNGGQPQKRDTLTLDASTGAVASWQPFSNQTTGQRARIWIRFLHTGEALGLAGQTVAGLVSLTSTLMVWTGLALAWRRLVLPLLKRRRTP